MSYYLITLKLFPAFVVNNIPSSLWLFIAYTDDSPNLLFPIVVGLDMRLPSIVQ